MKQSPKRREIDAVLAAEVIAEIHAPTLKVIASHSDGSNAKLKEAYPLLGKVNSPKEIKKLKAKQLRELADDLREYLVQSVSVSGGHFAAGLGTVELTVALHYVFDTPADQIVWDVGHQAYPHKILTGRKDRMTSIRTKDGVCAFPNRAESEYDAFGVGHSAPPSAPP